MTARKRMRRRVFFYSATAAANAIMVEREPEGPAAAVRRAVALPATRPRSTGAEPCPHALWLGTRCYESWSETC